MTYVEQELLPMGFHTVESTDKKFVVANMEFKTN